MNSGRNAAERPIGIHHNCLALPGFDVRKVLRQLETYGLKAREASSGPVPPLRYYISMRGPERGGAEKGTAELYFTDPDGLLIQLQDVSYCGGSGYLGNECPNA